MEITDEQLDEIGKVADSLDNLMASMSLPLDNKLHIEGIKGSLPDLSTKIKEVYKEISGDSPW